MGGSKRKAVMARNFGVLSYHRKLRAMTKKRATSRLTNGCLFGQMTAMLRPFVLIFVLNLLATSAALARVGETLNQCVERYGPVIEKRAARLEKSDAEACVFSKSGISVIIEFRAGIAWNIRYRAIDLIAAQVTELLKANMNEGGGWSAAYEVAGVQYRLAADRRTVAAYDPGKRGDIGILEISSRDFNKAWREVYGAKIEAVILQPTGKAGAKDLIGF